MELSPQLAEEIRLVWKKPLPDDISSPEYAELVNFLRQRRPDLLARLYAEVYGEENVQEVQQQLEARAKAREVVRAVGGEKDEKGRVVPSRTKGLLIIVGLGLLVLIPLGWYILAPVLFSGGSSKPQAQQPAPVQQEQAPATPPPPAEQPAPAEAPPPVTPPPAMPSETPPPPLPPVDQPPSYQEAQNQGGGQVQSSPPPPPPVPEGFAASTGAPGGSSGFVQELPKGTMDQLSPTSTPGSVSLGGVQGGVGNLGVPSSGSGVITNAVATGGAAFASPEQVFPEPEGPSPRKQDLVAQVNAERSIPNPAPRASAINARIEEEAKRLIEEVRPGQTIKARLEMGPVLGGGLTELPVLAKDSSGRLWFGTAKLAGQTGRVDILFDRVYMDGGFMPVQARALDLDGSYGVAATIQDLAPSLAADVLRAGISGVASYLQDLRNAQKVTVGPDGRLIISQEAPPLEYQVLGNVASLFQLPAQSSVVRVYRLDRGRQLEILVLGLGGGQ